jgi:hypothetical protein
MTSITPRKVVVFLGAGSSKQFGVPDAKGLFKGYLKSCTANKTKSNLTARLIKKMTGWGVDVTLENLLMLLDAYAKPEEAINRIRPFLPLIKTKANIMLDPKPKCGKIGKDIRNYVFRKCFIYRSKNIEKAVIFYDRILRGLKTYFSIQSLHESDLGYPYPNIPIFTTNFDNSIELFCRTQRVHVTDGYSKMPTGGYIFDYKEYDQSLNPNVLRLYKIHGTVRYVKNPSGEFDEVPYLLPQGSIFINGKECFPDLIFSESYQYTSNSPQLELLYSLKQELRISDRIVVMGYSFGDPHILTVFKEALQENNELRLILFSKHPDLIIKKRLSFVRDRCTCIPRDAELIDIATDLRNSGVPS